MTFLTSPVMSLWCACVPVLYLCTCRVPVMYLCTCGAQPSPTLAVVCLCSPALQVPACENWGSVTFVECTRLEGTAFGQYSGRGFRELKA